MVKMDFVSFDDVFDDVINYIEENKEQMKKYSGDDLCIDYNSYRAFAPSMVVLTLRHDGKIVGFNLFAVSPYLREKKMIEATNHGLFVERSFRAKYGKKIIQASDNFLRSLGVLKINYTNDNPAFGRLLASLNYKPRYTIWEKSYGQ